MNRSILAKKRLMAQPVEGVAIPGLSNSHSVDNFSVENRYILFIKCKISRLSEIIENCQVRNIHTNKFRHMFWIIFPISG